MADEPLEPRRLDASIDPRLNAICARATHPLRDQRYASARELEDDVLRYLDGEAVRPITSAGMSAWPAGRENISWCCRSS